MGQDRKKRRRSPGRARSGRQLRSPAVRVAVSAALAIATGCANPGPPRPPSLQLPELVTNLSVLRVGDTLELHWTTPKDATDDEPLRGPLTAVVCEAPTLAEQACRPVKTSPVASGPSSATVPLGPGQISGPPALLAVRVEIRNHAGRSAGLSTPALTAVGPAILPVRALKAEPVQGGARVTWTRVAGGAPVLLHRTLVEAATAPPRKPPATEADLQAADPSGTDPGGVLDKTAHEGETYRYTAQRVRTVLLEGHAVDLRSESSPAVSVQVHDVFPPAAPAGLAAVPGVAGDGAAPAIDLSWEPNAETDLAGYWVDRAELSPAGVPGPWTRLNPRLLTAPAWHDQAVVPGHRYAYRVVAVDALGNLSAPSATLDETAAAAP